MNIIYCGNIPEVADCFFMNESLNLLAVVVESGRMSDDMYLFSYTREVSIYETSNKLELQKYVASFKNVSAILVCGFGVILPPSLLSMVKAYNFHPGRLPNYKGRHPTFFATLAGETEINVTLHEVTTGIDEGEIIAIDRIEYGFKQNETYISERIPKSVQRLIPSLLAYMNGDIKGIKNEGGHYYPPVKECDKVFNSKDNIAKIINIIRAQTPHGGGIFEFDNRRFYILRVSISNIPINALLKDGVLIDNDFPIGIELKDRKMLSFTGSKEILQEA